MISTRGARVGNRMRSVGLSASFWRRNVQDLYQIEDDSSESDNVCPLLTRHRHLGLPAVQRCILKRNDSNRTGVARAARRGFAYFFCGDHVSYETLVPCHEGLKEVEGMEDRGENGASRDAMGS